MTRQRWRDRGAQTRVHRVAQQDTPPARGRVRRRPRIDKPYRDRVRRRACAVHRGRADAPTDRQCVYLPNAVEPPYQPLLHEVVNVSRASRMTVPSTAFECSRCAAAHRRAHRRRTNRPARVQRVSARRGAPQRAAGEYIKEFAAFLLLRRLSRRPSNASGVKARNTACKTPGSRHSQTGAEEAVHPMRVGRGIDAFDRITRLRRCRAKQERNRIEIDPQQRDLHDGFDRRPVTRHQQCAARRRIPLADRLDPSVSHAPSTFPFTR